MPAAVDIPSKREANALIDHYVGREKWEQGKAQAQKINNHRLRLERGYSRLYWEWGDLSLSIVPRRPKHSANRNLTNSLVALFMTEFGFPYEYRTLLAMRYTSAAWPRAKRCQAAWNAHSILNPRPDRFDIIHDGMTIQEAKAAAGHKPLANKTRKSASPAECARVIEAWSRTLAKRLPEEPDEQLISAITDAWMQVTSIIDGLGVLEELLAEYKEVSQPQLVAA